MNEAPLKPEDYPDPDWLCAEMGYVITKAGEVAPVVAYLDSWGNTCHDIRLADRVQSGPYQVDKETNVYCITELAYLLMASVQ